jgi:hypothetical protein
MKRADARKGQKVRVPVGAAALVGTIWQVGDRRLPGLRNAARIVFRDHPEVGAIWAPIEELEEVDE